MSTRLPFFWVDAFTRRVFGGNPAGVCPLESWLPDATMQAVACENGLSETAFFVPRAGSQHEFELRWFTPALEVDLCGHATLASAKVVLDELLPGRDEVCFHSRSGPLNVVRSGDRFEMDFPSQPGEPFDGLDAVSAALAARPVEVLRSVHYDMAVFESEAAVAGLRPDEAALLAHDALAVVATAPGTDADFVSRFFCPRAGIFEDPVTGSAHCVTTPYWAERLGRRELFARQISERAGELWCTQRGDRVGIAGQAVLYMRGEIVL